MLTKLKDCWLVLTGRLSSANYQIRMAQAQGNYDRLLAENHRLGELVRGLRQEINERLAAWDPVTGKARREDSDQIARDVIESMQKGGPKR